MFRRLVVLISACTLVASFVGAASAAPPELEDSMTGWAILTPGQSGVPFTPHERDQRETYASLADADNLNDNDLPTYFHELQFGSEDVEDEYAPAEREDVTIYRNTLGVAQVYGDTDDAMAFGLGYASAEDRMWQMDVFRHVARGQAASFIGDDYLGSDKVSRRDGYTDAELQQMFDDFDDRFGATGAQVQAMLEAYTEGINAFVKSAVDPGGENVPVEYFVTGNEMSDWSVLDSIALTVFQGRSFGGDGGSEVDRASDLKSLKASLGADVGEQVFADLMFRNDPDSPTTIPEATGVFPSPLWGEDSEVDPKAVAIPDKVKSVARKIERQRDAAIKAAARVGFPRLASNGIVVAGSQTVSGDPIHYGAPQVGYATPSFLYEIEGHSPNFDMAGPTVPGGGPSIVLGRTAHLAWMIPVGVGDMLDERVEKLCSPKKGKKVKRSSKYYKFGGDCIKMDVRTEHITDEAGDVVKVKVRRTVHGPVVATATVKGKPVAISQERTTWMKEPDLLVAFGMWANNATDTEAEFADGVEVFPMSFNILYADSDQVAYYYGGIHAIRAAGVDRRLPSWGTGQWEWQGLMTEEQRPRMIDPEQGWFANWNSKPSVGWNSSASSTWGAAQRLRLLADGMEAHVGPFKMSDVVEVAATAATQDSYAWQLWPILLDQIQVDGEDALTAFVSVGAWVADGAHRTDADRDEIQDNSTAVAVWDTMLNNLLERVFGDELGDISAYGIRPVDDAPNGGGYFFSLPDYLLNLVSGEAAKYSRDYCDNIDTDGVETCGEQVTAAFNEAVETLTTELGPGPTTWEWPAEYTTFSEFGGTTADPFPWQNRGTWNHILELHD